MTSILMKTLKSIGAVLAGILINVILSTVTDFILESAGIFPPITEGLFVTWMLVVALAYRAVYAVLGGYVTVRLAPSNPLLHLKWLMGIGTVMGVAGIFAGWNMSQHWYPISLVITSVAGTWWGGKCFLNRKAK